MYVCTYHPNQISQSSKGKRTRHTFFPVRMLLRSTLSFFRSFSLRLSCFSLSRSLSRSFLECLESCLLRFLLLERDLDRLRLFEGYEEPEHGSTDRDFDLARRSVFCISMNHMYLRRSKSELSGVHRTHNA